MIDVGNYEFPIGVSNRCSARKEFSELPVVGISTRNGLLKDRWIRRDSTNTAVNPALHLAVFDPVSPHVVEPRTLILGCI